MLGCLPACGGVATPDLLGGLEADGSAGAVAPIDGSGVIDAGPTRDSAGDGQDGGGGAAPATASDGGARPTLGEGGSASEAGTDGAVYRDAAAADAFAPGPTFGFVQGTSATPPAFASMASASFPRPQGTGHLNVVVVSWGDATADVGLVTDTAGNAYQHALGPTRAPGVSQSIYYAAGIAAGANTVQVTLVSGVSRADIRALEYAGLDPSSPLDATAGQSGTGTAATCGPVSTHWQKELIVAAGSSTDTFGGPGPQFTLRELTADGDLVEDRLVATAGSYAGSAPLPFGVNWVMQLATFH
jgi:hypothetical protein